MPFDPYVEPSSYELTGKRATAEYWSISYANILMSTVQAPIAHGVLDAVRAGVIPKDKVNDLGIIYSVWLGPSGTEVEVDHKALFDVHRSRREHSRPGTKNGRSEIATQFDVGSDSITSQRSLPGARR